MNFDYDYKTEYAKWKKKKDKKEKELRQKGVDEDVIMQLHQMDNMERKYNRHKEVVKDDFWTSIPDKRNKAIVNISNLIDELENEILYEIIKNLDDETKKIVELKYQEYFVWEIAEITKLSIDQINYRIKKISELFKNSKN